MRIRVSTTVATYGILGGIAAVSFLMPDHLSVSGVEAVVPPPEMRLTGTIRDFASTHPDFDLPAAGPEHCAGNAATTLGSDGRPAAASSGGGPLAGYSGIGIAGNIVMQNSTRIDVDAASPGSVTTNLAVPGAITMSGTSEIAGDALTGPGSDPATSITVSSPSPGVTGLKGALPEPLTMPVIMLPTDFGPSVGDRTDSSAATISASLHANTWRISNGAIITISGNVAILCEHEFIIDNGGSAIELAADATLDIYVKGNDPGDGQPGQVTLSNGGSINVNTGDPARVTIYYLGTADVIFDNGTRAYANLVAPNARIDVGNAVEVWGNVVANELLMRNTGHLTMMGAFPGAPDAYAVDTEWQDSGARNIAPHLYDGGLGDTAGVAGSTGCGELSSAGSFDEWFRDVPGVNLSRAHTISLTADGSGNYEYIENEFYPIDGQLMGDEGEAHNYNFTYHVRAQIVYDAGAGMFLEFQGGDGAWGYLDGNFVMDMGGAGGAEVQYLDLDRLGLTDGQTYTFDLFHTQRRAADSAFHFRTNIEFAPPAYAVTVSAPFD